MPIEFPFTRGPWYTFADFLSFEESLRVTRRQDKELDLALGLSRERWMTLRTNEMYTLLHFARLEGVERTASFRICPEGAEADLELIDGGRIRRLQITTAGPLWSAEERNWGRDYALHIES